MLTERARLLVRQAHPHDDVALIVSVNTRPADVEVNAHRDRTSRRQFVNAFYERAKAPVIRQVQALETNGVRIVDRLEGTPQIIIAARAETWRSVLLRPDPMLKTPNVTISPNDPEVTLP